MQHAEVCGLKQLPYYLYPFEGNVGGGASVTVPGDSHQTARHGLFRGLQIWSRVGRQFEHSPQAMRLVNPSPRGKGPRKFNPPSQLQGVERKTLGNSCSKISDLLEDAAPEPLTQKWRWLWGIQRELLKKILLTEVDLITSRKQGQGSVWDQIN